MSKPLLWDHAVTVTLQDGKIPPASYLPMGGDHCHNSTRARFSYSGRAISYSGRAVSYSGRAISYSGRAVSYLGGAISYLGGAISLQLRNSTLGKNVLLQLRYRHDTS